MRSDGDSLEWVTALEPTLKAALERPDSRDAAAVQPERRTGARSFVGSTTVEDNVAVARNLLVPSIKLSWGHVQRTR